MDDLLGVHPVSRLGRKYLVEAYAMKVAALFQGFCRALYSEVVDHVATLAPKNLISLLKTSLTQDLPLDRGNAKRETISNAFERLELSDAFWKLATLHDSRTERHLGLLMAMNKRRNAIAHHDLVKFSNAELRIGEVHQWRKACTALARSCDAVMRAHLTALLGAPPW